MLLAKIQEIASATPERAALTWNGRDMSYGRLLSLIHVVRARVQAAGVSGPGLVLVNLSNLALEWPWILGLQSLGLTTVSAGTKLAAMLALPPLTLMVGENDADDRAILAPVRIGADAAASIMAGAPVHQPPLDDAARAGHLMLSSGTTGRPKLVHFDGACEAATNVLWVKGMEYDETTVIYLAGFPLLTAAGYRSPPRAWAFGGRIVLHQGPDPWAPFRPRDLTIGIVTPGMLDELMNDYPDEAACNPGLVMFVGGGQVAWPVVEAAKRRLTPKMYALYGSTEAGTVSVMLLDRPEDTHRYATLECRSVQIVDEDGDGLMVGETGLVRTDTRDGVYEYWNDPETTARHFKDGWFYPGDLGRIVEDGRLELMGRADDVLVVGGDKRAAVDFERAITADTGLIDFCLVQMQGPDPEAVHLVYAAEADIDPALAERVRGVMPRHATLVFHRRGTLPRNAMGKVLRIAVRNDLVR